MLIKAYCYLAQLSSYANYDKTMRKIHHDIEWGKHMENAVSRLIHIRYKNARTLSAFHGTGGFALYLTGNLSYALVYIWDVEKAGARVKRITCGILRGVVYCEERFANQLEEFYGGVAGYVYRVENTPDFAPVSGREDMFYSSRSASVKDVLRVDDVYEALLDYERQGSFKLLRFSDASAEKREKLIDSDASYILDNGMLAANTEQAAFMRRYFTDAWERALA